ncbi:hypothetical protein SDC9_200856 [bioreactor metagenome]|uniref:DNA methylase adenine-specific domain-containing protein n=1 Tax=bioreactor metagenome TaxID=1076179 RepID=A0A645IQM2_9ZZZZ
MPKICENGVYREITIDEVATVQQEFTAAEYDLETEVERLKQLVADLSTLVLGVK